MTRKRERHRTSASRTLLIAILVVLFLAPAAHAAGSFTSSDPLLNLVWQKSVRTATDMLAPGPVAADWLGRACAINVPTVILDGTVRDRCPYIGDEVVIDGTLDVSTPEFSVQRAMLAWFAAAQHADGAIPSSPLFQGQIVLFDYNGYWLQALDQYALYSGDLALVRQVWPNVQKLIDWYAARARADGLLTNDLGANDYAFVRRHGNVVAYFNAQYVLALRDAAQMASWIGEIADAGAWSARASFASAAFAPAFWDSSVDAFQDTTTDPTTHPQDGNSFAVIAGIATPTQATSAMSYLWQHNQRDYGNTISDSHTWDDPAWGDQGSERVYPFMSYFEVLAWFRIGRADAALNLVRREWGYMAQQGSGTMWETIGPYGGGPTDQHQSWDAGWSSGAAPALTQYVLGVQPTSPGFATFTVNPQAGGRVWGIASASGTVPTPHGDISVAWRIVGDRMVVKVRAPAGTKQTTIGAASG